ncbi:MAG: hypothetical protein QOF73_3018 [Thermomicrobiales bacterium]|nr:hypothetical protein [Thermomicrobiales bacterium]
MRGLATPYPIRIDEIASSFRRRRRISWAATMELTNKRAFWPLERASPGPGNGKMDMEHQRDEPIRFSGGTLDRYRHVCAVVESSEEMHRIFNSFVREGIERGEKALHIVEPNERTTSTITSTFTSPCPRSLGKASSSSGRGTRLTSALATLTNTRCSTFSTSGWKMRSRRATPVPGWLPTWAGLRWTIWASRT